MKCTECDQEKDEAEFSFRKKAENLRFKKCKKCVSAYNKAHYQSHKKQYREKARRWEIKFLSARRAFIDELKSKPCVDCGRTFPACAMDFDHLPGTKKEYNLSYLARRAVGEQTFMEELSKCEVVCACCHRIRTASRRFESSRGLSLVGCQLNRDHLAPDPPFPRSESARQTTVGQLYAGKVVRGNTTTDKCQSGR